MIGYKYTASHLLVILPPACLHHGRDGDLPPFCQIVQLAEELERRACWYEVNSYESLSHYFSTSADNATMKQLFQD